MPRNRNVPNVNASLIREVRMIAQQFFRSKDSQAFWGRHAPTPPPAAFRLKCSQCMETTSEPQTAVTVYNGNALCEKHRWAMSPHNR